MSARPLIAATAAVALIAAGVGLRLATRDTPTTPPPAAAAPAPAPRADAEALPARVPGYDTGPVALTSYRLSLVFRTRNTLLNGLSGRAGDHEVETARADRGGRRGLLVGVAARPGTDPPPVTADVNRVVGVAPESRFRAAGRPVTVYAGPGYRLAVVGDGPRRAVVVIGTGRSDTRALATAVARGLAGSS